MNKLTSNNDMSTMSSIEIAELTGKRHDHVIRDIRNMFAELSTQESVPSFGDTYIHPQNNETYNIYRLPKREALILTSGYSIIQRANIIDRWQELEAKQSPSLPNYQEALRQLADQLDITHKQTIQLEAQKPAVEFVERYVESTGNKGFREVCKLLKANEARFKEFMTENKIMYRLDGKLMPYGNHLDAGRFEVNAGIAENEHAFTTAKFTPKGINWVAGLWAVHNLEG